MPSSLDKNPDLAVGLKLPFGPGQSNFALNFTTVDQTKTNLMNLLLTQKGERFMQPKSIFKAYTMTEECVGKFC